MHSMGGAIGVLLAEKLGKQLETFIIVEGNLIAEDCNTSRKIISVSYEQFKKQTFQEIKDTFIKSPESSYQLWAHWLDKSTALACYKSAESLVAWSDSGKLLTKFKEQNNNKIYIYGEKSSVQKKKLLSLLENT